MSVYFPDAHTPEEWRAMATRSSDAEAESWERSDTDGFLSQKAFTVMAFMYRDLATLAENGGREEIRWLFDAETGEPIENWRWVETRYGGSILVGDGDDAVWFNPSHARKGATRLARDKAKGFVWGDVETEVVVMMSGWHHITRRKNDAVLKIVHPVSPDYEIDN